MGIQIAKYIHCTCGQPMVFTINEPVDTKSDQQNVVVTKQIRIGGGAYVITKDSKIPRDVITPVTAEELELLHQNDAYVRMCKRGFIVERDENYMVADSKGNPDNMQKKDMCSQISDEEHARGTDPRCDHAQSRASWGEGNQYGGEQPLIAQESSYGAILI